MKYIFSILVCVGVAAGCGGRRASSATERAADQPATAYTYRIKNVYPHDESAYTQGLYMLDGALYEGTGQYGASALRRVDLETGRVGREVKLPENVFGEGIAQLDGKIYQLTWREGRAFVYDARTFERLSEFRYTGEGWGLTTDGKRLYMSDGTSRIRVLDPATFREEGDLVVIRDGRAVEALNELEWIDGEIWANVFMTNEIVRIDPESGRVTGVVDLTGILPPADHTPKTDVLNGIAWDSVANRIFVTGKNWKKLFEIEVLPR